MYTSAASIVMQRRMSAFAAARGDELARNPQNHKDITEKNQVMATSSMCRKFDYD